MRQTGLDAVDIPPRGADVRGVDRRRQPVDRVVRHGQRLVERVEFGDGEHRPEDLLAKHFHVTPYAGEDRGADEVAASEANLRRRPQPSAHPRSAPCKLPYECPDIAADRRPVPCRSSPRDPSPTVIFSQRATSFSRNGPAIERCSWIRLVDVHHWPALEKPAVTAASSAASMSASAITINAFLPPSSSCMQSQIPGGPGLDRLADLGRSRERILPARAGPRRSDCPPTTQGR